jgi:CheY-like chemotaxis protein
MHSVVTNSGPSERRMEDPRRKLLGSATTQRGVDLDRRVRVEQAGPTSEGLLRRPPLRVLVVDDDMAIRDLVTAALLDEGYHVLAAVNGTHALQRLQGFQPDGILLDIQMPEMDGPTFAERYRQTPGPHAPIVVFSAAGCLAEWTERIGAAAAVDKPFDLASLPDLLVACAMR